jgi:hypothetical protein
MSTEKVKIGSLFALIYLGLSSLSFAYAPNGFDGATLVNHIYAIITVISGFKILFDYD